MDNINEHINVIVSSSDDSYINYLYMIEKKYNKYTFLNILEYVVDYLKQLMRLINMDMKKNPNMKNAIYKSLLCVDKKYLKIKNIYMQKKLELDDRKRR